MNQTRQNVERGIYKQPGSPNFYISFADATGKIVRQSTGSDSIAEARRQRKKALADAENGKPAAPRQRKVTIGALFAMIRADYQTNNRRMRPLEIAIKRLHDEFEDHESAITIVADRIAVYATKRLDEEGYARSTVRDLAILKRAYRIAIDLGRIGTAPVIKPPTVGDNARRGFLDHAEFTRLLGSLPEDLRDPVEFLYWSGWRVGEMRTIEWRDVRLSEGTILLDPAKSKNKDGRELPLEGRLLEIIQRAAATRTPESTFVFRRANGLPVALFRKSWATACREAGLGKIHVHDLRRTAIRNLVRAGVSDKIAMELSGHKTRSIFDRYNISASADRKAAMRALHYHIEGQPSATLSKVVPLHRAAS